MFKSDPGREAMMLSIPQLIDYLVTEAMPNGYVLSMEAGDDGEPGKVLATKGETKKESEDEPSDGDEDEETLEDEPLPGAAVTDIRKYKEAVSDVHPANALQMAKIETTLNVLMKSQSDLAMEVDKLNSVLGWVTTQVARTMNAVLYIHGCTITGEKREFFDTPYEYVMDDKVDPVDYMPPVVPVKVVQKEAPVEVPEEDPPKAGPEKLKRTYKKKGGEEAVPLFPGDE